MDCQRVRFTPQATPEDLFLITALDADRSNCEALEENVVCRPISYKERVVRSDEAKPNRESVKISHFEGSKLYQRGPFR